MIVHNVDIAPHYKLIPISLLFPLLLLETIKPFKPENVFEFDSCSRTIRKESLGTTNLSRKGGRNAIHRVFSPPGYCNIMISLLFLYFSLFGRVGWSYSEVFRAYYCFCTQGSFLVILWALYVMPGMEPRSAVF